MHNVWFKKYMPTIKLLLKYKKAFQSKSNRLLVHSEQVVKMPLPKLSNRKMENKQNDTQDWKHYLLVRGL